MKHIPQLRLASHQLIESRCRTAADVVTALGAVQAQDYGSAVWAIGCRIPGSTEADIERAVRERTIVRTWPMRGTIHFVPADDVRWMLALLAPRVIKSTAARVRSLELDDAIFAKAERILVKAMRGKWLSREDTLQTLERAGISTADGRGYHIIFRLSMLAVLCGGPREGKTQTFTLLDEWVPKSKSLSREEGLTLLARRFFTGHAPATAQDFAWWAGLKIAEAKAAHASIVTELVTPQAADSTHLLPGFDEYLLGYKDRSAVLDAAHADKIVPGGNGIFLPMMVRNGRIVGRWKRTISKSGVRVTLEPFVKTSLKPFDAAVERYVQFFRKGEISRKQCGD